MMFVSGEVAEPLSETTGLVEDIVRGQVVEMVSQSIPLELTSIRLSKQLRKLHGVHQNRSPWMI